MHVTIECDNIVGVLSRVLDQTRRVGIDVSYISAKPGTVILILEQSPDQLSHTLGRRMALIEGVTSLAMEPCSH